MTSQSLAFRYLNSTVTISINVLNILHNQLLMKNDICKNNKKNDKITKLMTSIASTIVLDKSTYYNSTRTVRNNAPHLYIEKISAAVYNIAFCIKYMEMYCKCMLYHILFTPLQILTQEIKENQRIKRYTNTAFNKAQVPEDHFEACK